MSTRIIYLDNNATTCCAPEVVDAMAPFLASSYGNPSSLHYLGMQARLAVVRARETIAGTLGCDPSEIYFTSGATESNNQVLASCKVAKDRPSCVAVSAVEHRSILAPAEALKDSGIVINKIAVTPDGVVSLKSARDLIGKTTQLVSVQLANNETGAIQPLQELASVAHGNGAVIHCDASQMLGKGDLNLRSLDVDYASASAHKVYGPKGIGLLFVSHFVKSRHLPALLRGGSQEESLRAGTLNVPGIVGFAAACDLAMRNLAEETNRIRQLRDLFERIMLSQVPGARVNGCLSNRLPSTSSLTLPGVPADTLIANATYLCISGGSACTEGSVVPSHVLLAMGLTRDEAESTIRVGVGRYSSRSDIEDACEGILSAIRLIRANSNSPTTGH